MRRFHRGRTGPIGAGAALLALVLVLAGAGPSKTRQKLKLESQPITTDETVANLAYIVTGLETKLEGIGLVSGLDNTGMDPPPSWYRTKLVEEMQKAGVENSNQLLADPRFAMVLVRMTLPTGIATSDRLDVTIELPPASGTKSLAGGYLMETRLREVLVAGTTPKEGAPLAIARGPVMIGSEKKPDDPKLGRVLGGARPLRDIPFNLLLKESRRSFKSSSIVEKAVNQRFPLTVGVNQKGVAEAKTDQNIVLKVPRIYHQNQGRFFEVVKRIPLVDTPELRARRQEAWGRELLDPATAGTAALKLEALGATATEALRPGLASPNAQVRYFAAEALALLNDASGVDALGAAVVVHKEFRAVAFAALAELDQPAAHLKLRQLMEVPDVEVRYGAFNALRTLDEHDPFLGRVRVVDTPAEDADEEPADNMAVALRRASRNRGRFEEPFTLYLVDCEGPPMVHVANNRRCEIVIFGRGQTLLTPVVLGTGPILLNAADGDDVVQISKIVASRVGDGDNKVRASLELGDIIRQMVKLGANYPEIVAILTAAHRQKNLPGPLVVNAVPVPSLAYIDAALHGKDLTKKDDALTKTRLETTLPPKRPPFLKRMFRNVGTAAPAPTPTRGSKDQDAATAKALADDPVAVLRGQGSNAAKKDDAVRRSTEETPAPKRPTLFRMFQRRNDPEATPKPASPADPLPSPTSTP